MVNSILYTTTVIVLSISLKDNSNSKIEYCCRNIQWLVLSLLKQ